MKKLSVFITIILILSIYREGFVSGRKELVPLDQALDQTNYFLIVKASKNPYKDMWIKELPHKQYYIELEIVEIIYIDDENNSDEEWNITKPRLEKMKGDSSFKAGQKIAVVNATSIRYSLMYEQGKRKIYFYYYLDEGVKEVKADEEYILLAESYSKRNHVFFGAVKHGLINKTKKNLAIINKHIEKIKTE